MTEISSTTATPATTSRAHGRRVGHRGRSRTPRRTLDKDGFLKLFITQLQHQDPSAPMDASESIAQMASFSMVEGMNNMQATNSSIASSLNTSSAVGLIGRTVSYVDDKGELQTGKVDRVATTKDGQATLTVAGKPGIDPSLIAEVSA